MIREIIQHTSHRRLNCNTLKSGCLLLGMILYTTCPKDAHASTLIFDTTYAIQGAMFHTAANGDRIWDGFSEATSTFSVSRDGVATFRLDGTYGNYEGQARLDPVLLTEPGSQSVALKAMSASGFDDFTFTKDVDPVQFPESFVRNHSTFGMVMDGLFTQRNLADITKGTTINFWMAQYDSNGTEIGKFDTAFDIRGILGSTPPSNSPGASVPEPASVSLLGLALVQARRKILKSRVASKV